ncbi:microtubule-associated tumor suppressor candidate 2 isoform X3 [Oncorhynchus keta]|uniref:microtubule-associated tumor suppressor candidate 2 isoform X1 n=1 Tax=Oncorhynchus keta TaxID=8018 RepID=UPI00227C45B1|nr:microtubule-associated tumor suppressor candidate 2 isoform X1 [Oncorhynchus keta]XP_052376065.1 microtubule-associated tumor suppressor candidate 2 isoform X2 [Oncorhynchus keta]XP_052376066.1 microtubule-associated tumor suppressor candidate 2 isoform X3 [Oncorhynchus keta]
MSVPAGLQSLSVSGRDIKNYNKSHVLFHPPTGDANANQIVLIGETPDDQASSPLPPLVAQSEAQDKLLIWGREERCLDHDIQELELLEIHSFHGDGGEGGDGKRLGEVEEDDEGENSKRGADEGLLSISSSSTASGVSVHGNDNDGRDRGMDRQKEVAGEREVLRQDLNYSVPRSGKETGGGGGGGEQNSVGDKGSLCVSAVSTLSSSLDPTGHPLTSNPNPTTSAKRRAPPVGLNSTAAPHSQDTPNLGELPYPRSPDQEVHHQHQETSNLDVGLSRGQSATEEGSKLDVTTQRQDVRCYQGNSILSSSDGGIGQRKKGVGAPPPRRQQLVRPLCQLEPGRGRSLAEPITRRRSSTSPSLSPDAGRKVVDPGHHGVDVRQTQETLEVKSSMVNCSSYSHLHSHPHYQPSSSPGAPQPSQASQSAQREARSLDRRRSSAERTASLERRHQHQDQSQLRYRRTNRCGATVTSQPCSHTPPRSPLRTPQGSPRRQDQQQQQPMSPSRIITGSARYPQGYGSSGLRPPLKSNLASTGIPIPPLHHQAPNPSPSPPKPKGVRPKIITYIRKGPQLKPQASDGPYQVSSLPSRLSAYTHTHSPATNMPQKHSSSPKTHTNTHSRGIASRNTPVLSASNLLYDKYRQEMQKNRLFNSGMMGTGIRGYTHTVPPTHTQSGSHTHTHTHTGAHTHSHTAPPKLGSKAESFYGPLVDKYQPAEMSRNAGSLGREDPSGPRMATQAAQAGGTGSLLRSGIGLRPQLGLGAVARATPGSVVFTATKNQMMVQGQRTALGFSQPVQAVSPATNQNGQDNTGDQQRPSPTPAPSQTPRTLLPSQSALRAPGFSSVCLPPGASGAPGAGRLAAFGFIRSSSVSSVSSLHSVESSPSDLCRRPSVCVDPPLYRVTNPPCTDPQRGGGPPNYATRNLQPPSTPALPRRYLPAQPRGSPVGVRKEFPRSSEITRSLPSSPKRLAVVPPKPQSPVLPRQRPAAATRGAVPPCSPRRVPPFRPKQEQQENLQREKEEAQLKEREREEQEREREREKQREEVQRLQNRCVEQEDQLTSLREELRKTTLGLQAFIITSQHYCLQNESATEKEKELSLKIQRIKQEVASNTTQWERLQKEKAELEVGFERELTELQLQQEEELAAVEAELRVCHSKETEHLRAEHQEEVEEIRTQQQEQMDELTVNHEAAIQELRDMHNITMTTLYEEHARTMRDLRKSHEQQKVTLEEDFEKLRLSLQDQVDTLLFQKSSLRDKAKRFEEALRRSTDEHIVDTLAPYQHIEEDLKSLKDVVEMKNNQIHQQEKKISDLERVAQKNVVLEERMQVLQQQNEDLMARIDNNLALSRQLSEENANLQENVEKENGEKKRLSRNNEELLWRLQTSPLCSPCSSPIHRSFSTSPTPSSCLFSSSPGMGGGTGFDAPSHYCGGYPAPTHGYSPSHRENLNQSPGPATPTHRGFSNQNQSPGPATPTHRVSPNHCHSPARLNPLMR